MAATEILASGTTRAAATEIALTAGTPVTLTIHFTGSSQGVAYEIAHKNAAGNAYQNMFTLTPDNQWACGTLRGSGTYRATRVQSANASSLERD
jgi:hypothetical protein